MMTHCRRAGDPLSSALQRRGAIDVHHPEMRLQLKRR